MSFSISPDHFILFLFGLFCVGLVFVFLLKKIFHQYANPLYSIFKFRSTFLGIGFLWALIFTLFLFGITVNNSSNVYQMEVLPLQEDTIQIVRTIQKPKKLELPKAESIEASDELIPDDQPEFVDPEDLLPTSLDSLLVEDEMPTDTTFEGITDQPQKIPKLPEPPAIEDDEPPVLDISEINPRFPGCEHLQISKKEREICAQQKLFDFIYENLSYPIQAKELGKQGRVTVQFIVNEHGRIQNVKILRGVGFGLDDAAKRVVEKMNEMTEPWSPGIQMGRKVRVRYTMPITFKLN